MAKRRGKAKRTATRRGKAKPQPPAPRPVEPDRLQQVLHERRLLALNLFRWSLLERRGVELERMGAARTADEQALDNGLANTRRRGPLSTLSDEKLAVHRAAYPPGAADKTGKILSRNRRAKMLGVSRHVLARRAPDLAR